MHKTRMTAVISMAVCKGPTQVKARYVHMSEQVTDACEATSWCRASCVIVAAHPSA
jgi:hypothetical protein